MKKYLISSFILLAILIPLAVWGWGVVMMGGGVPSGSACPDCILEETFETSEYDNNTCGSAPCVTETAGTPNGDGNEASNTIGTYSLELQNGGDRLEFRFAAQDTVYVMYKFEMKVIDASVEFMRVQAGNANFAEVYIFLATSMTRISIVGGSSTDTTVTSHTADASLWVKFKIVKGTGANAELHVSHWNGSSWDAYVSVTDGTNSNQIDEIWLVNNQNAANEDYFFDNVKISTTEFTNDPTTY